VLALFESALDAKGKRFLLDVGADYEGPARFENDYLLVGKELGRGLVRTPFLNYRAALRVKARPGSQILAAIREPYFDRTYAHYCSHQNTPYQLEDAPHPGALQQGRVLYLAHALGELYHVHGARLHRDFFLNALRRLHRRPVLSTKLPSEGRANLLHQPQHQRYVVHLLFTPPLVRGRCQVLEDFVPLCDVPVRLRVPETIRRAWLAPSKKSLRLQRRAGAVVLVVPTVKMHQIVVCEY
jgi:hypothetical protein